MFGCRVNLGKGKEIVQKYAPPPDSFGKSWSFLFLLCISVYFVVLLFGCHETQWKSFLLTKKQTPKMWNITMRAFGEGLELEQKEIESHVYHVLFLVLFIWFFVLVLVRLWIDGQFIEDLEDENHVEWGIPFFIFL